MKERVASVFAVAVSVFFLAGAVSTPSGIGALPRMGANVFPRIISIAMAVVSTGLSLFGRRKGAPREGDSGRAQRGLDLVLRNRVVFLRLVTVTVMVIVYAFVLDAIGYVTSTVLFSVFCLWVVGGPKWLRNGAVAVVLAAAMYFLFNVGLGITLPVLPVSR